MTLLGYIKKINTWVGTSYALSEKELASYRILYCLVIIFLIGIPNYSWIAGHPSFIYNPPTYSIASLFESYPGWLFLESLSISIMLLFIFLLFGFYTRLVSVLLTILMIIGQSFAFSFGKIDHNILFVLLPLTMAFSGWGNYYSIDQQRNNKTTVNSWTVVIVALVLGFAMFTAGVPKYLHGWLDISTQATHGYFIRKYYSNSELAILAPFLKSIDSKLFWESFDYLAVIFELGFLVAVFKPSVFRFFIFLALCFHFINGLMINVFFIGNNVVYLLFLKKTTFQQGQVFIEKYSLRFINFKTLILSAGLGILSLLFVQSTDTFSELLMAPSIMKLLLSFFTTDEGWLNAMLVSAIGLSIGLYYCWNFIRKKTLNV